MGCTSAKNKFSAFGLHHHCTRVRDLAQLVAHTSGGREVAGSSPVIPTERKEADNRRVSASFLFFFRLYCGGLFSPTVTEPLSVCSSAVDGSGVWAHKPCTAVRSRAEKTKRILNFFDKCAGNTGKCSTFAAQL